MPTKLPPRGSTPRPAPSPGTTTLDPIAAKLLTLGLEYPASVLPELVEQAARDDLSPLAFLDLNRPGFSGDSVI